VPRPHRIYKLSSAISDARCLKTKRADDVLTFNHEHCDAVYPVRAAQYLYAMHYATFVFTVRRA